METYTVEELSKQLKDMGYDVSSRTIKYYAYEKNMLQNLKAGKKSFTKDELDDIVKIQKLKNCTSMKLDQIREFIKNKDVCDIDNYIANQYCNTIFKSSSSVDSNHYYTGTLNNSMNMTSLSNNYNWSDTKANSRGIQAYCKSTEKEVSVKNNANDSNKTKRSIQVTDDILITVTKNVDNEKLKQIVKFIKSL